MADAVTAAARPGVALLDDPDDQGGCAEPGEKSDFGLALSGGGYRAMLFHLGALEACVDCPTRPDERRPRPSETG